MSKLLYICLREGKIEEDLKDKLGRITNLLCPPNLADPELLFYHQDRILFSLTRANSCLTERQNILLGSLFEQWDKWNTCGSPAPDGNYAIIRADEDNLEILSDCLGSRSIWYYFAEDVMIASSSQVAILEWIGNYHFDQRVVPWMISTGSLGVYSWDRRIKKIPSDGKVTVNRKKWTIDIQTNPVVFRPRYAPAVEIEADFEKTLQKTFQELSINYDRTAITLSGGYDSRAILLLLNRMKKPHHVINTITWGEKGSLNDDRSDASISQRLAKKFNTNHRYFNSDGMHNNPEEIIERFLTNGEGRIDHLTGYLDGFKLWEEIAEKNFTHLMRGDEVFGYNSISSPKIIRSYMALTTISDYKNLSKYPYLRKLRQNMPEELKISSGETLAMWRDRVYQSYRIPFIQSALADLKQGYVEQINPFLSRNIVYQIRGLTDKMRSDKALFKKVIRKYDVSIPYATRKSNSKMSVVLKNEDFVEVIKKELDSPLAQDLFPREFLQEVKNDLQITSSKKRKTIHQNNFREWPRKIVPLKIKKLIAQKRDVLNLDPNILGFRLLIIIRMYRRLSSIPTVDRLQ